MCIVPASGRRANQETSGRGLGTKQHSPDVFLTVYAHALDSRKREAMEGLDEAWEAAQMAQ